jgi:4-amino-4-deoxy-L-arabinose transferase-like glycosyltransferase
MGNKRRLLLLLGILFFAFLVRLHGFTNPIADWHSWRQADTSSVSRTFVTEGFDLLHPRFDDLSNVPSGKENPQGYRFVEFPIYNVFQAGLFKLIGIFTLEEWGRLISIAASLAATFFLYKIVAKHTSTTAGLLTAFFYAFLPYDIYYGRTILPDPSMVATILGGIYFFDQWASMQSKVESRTTRALASSKRQESKDAKQKTPKYLIPHTSYLVCSLLFTAAAFLLKPYALFYTLPMVVLAYNAFGWRMIAKWQLWVFAIVSVAPLAWWRLWMQQFPEGIPANAWLLNGNGIRFRPAFFRWMGYERLIKLLSGYVGVIFVALGLYQLRFEKSKLFYSAFVLSALLYVIIFATGNVQHDYYQIVIMPSVAIVYGLGAYFLLQAKKLQRWHLGVIITVLVTAGAFYLSWHQVRDYFNINNHSIVIAGKAVDQLTPKDAKVIANYTGDTSFLYQTKRKGWASFEHSLPEMVKMGADYLVLANPTKDDEKIAQEYKVIKQTPDYMLLNLHQKP